MKAIPKSWKRVKQVKVYCSDEKGELGAQQRTLWLDPTGDASFVMELPEYVCAALGVEQFVRFAMADKVAPRVESIMREYADWAKNAAAVPVIIINAKYFGEAGGNRELRRQSFFIDSEMGHNRAETTRAIGLQYWLAFRVNGNIHAREVERYIDDDHQRDRTKDKITVGWNKGPEDRQGGVVLDYTPELHARVDAIMTAINNAVINLHDILEAKDVAKALLSLRPGTGLLPAPKDSA